MIGSKVVAMIAALVVIVGVAAAGLYVYRQQHEAPPSAGGVARSEGPAPMPEQPKPQAEVKSEAKGPTAVPSFDVVRIEPSGEGVLAGRAEPGWQVNVEDQGAKIASALCRRGGSLDRRAGEAASRRRPFPVAPIRLAGRRPSSRLAASGARYGRQERGGRRSAGARRARQSRHRNLRRRVKTRPGPRLVRPSRKLKAHPLPRPPLRRLRRKKKPKPPRRRNPRRKARRKPSLRANRNHPRTTALAEPEPVVPPAAAEEPPRRNRRSHRRARCEKVPQSGSRPSTSKKRAPAGSC